MDSKCENFEKCPIYTGVLKDKTITAQGYRKQFCEAEERGWLKCKRYIVKQQTGKCPPDLLPNSFKSVEEIIISMQ
jgi:hypothetical protein